MSLFYFLIFRQMLFLWGVCYWDFKSSSNLFSKSSFLVSYKTLHRNEIVIIIFPPTTIYVLCTHAIEIFLARDLNMMIIGTPFIIINYRATNDANNWYYCLKRLLRYLGLGFPCLRTPVLVFPISISSSTVLPSTQLFQCK